jgi:hypothetical protein
MVVLMSQQSYTDVVYRPVGYRPVVLDKWCSKIHVYEQFTRMSGEVDLEGMYLVNYRYDATRLQK